MVRLTSTDFRLTAMAWLNSVPPRKSVTMIGRIMANSTAEIARTSRANREK